MKSDSGKTFIQNRAKQIQLIKQPPVHGNRQGKTKVMGLTLCLIKRARHLTTKDGSSASEIITTNQRKKEKSQHRSNCSVQQ